MVRTVLANRKLERYIQKIAEDKKFSYGIIIGQTSSLNKDYVVYLAKTSELPENYESEKSTNSKSNVSNATTITKSESRVEETLENFVGQNLINHSVNVTKMIPGSFYVLGVFVITEQNVSQNNEHVNKFKNVFREIHCALDHNKFFCGHPSTQENGEKVLLNYVWSSQSFECKLYDSTGTNPTPVDWKFLDKPTVWHMFESSYELDEVFPIKEGHSMNLERNFLTSLEYISNYIATSEIFIQNENVDDNQPLENYIKEKINKKESIESFKASILQLTSITPKCPPTISEYQGTIRYVGTIYSRVWVHPKSSFKDIQTFIRNDVVRSLAARIQIFCDGLTNPNVIPDAVIVNIPPKRVFFDIPDSGGIQFSEYLFNGENAHTVVEQAKDILDLTIEEDNVAMEFETLPDYEDAISIYAQPSVTNVDQQEVHDGGKKMMFYGGIGIAMAVLIFSILLHFIWR